MASEIKSLCLVLVIAATFGLTVVDGEPKVPCYFIFGDSLFDIGNNNMLDTKAKVNYPPYGIDFPEGPTGRFSNGRNMADFMGEFLGFEKYIPSFSTAKNKDVLLGVNYASGGSGIRGESGKHLGDRISMDKQLTNHIITVSKIILSLGSRKAKDHLSKCIYTVNMGSNDYINNYFLPSFYPATSQKYTTEQYAEVLIQQYSRQLKKLYFLGARKVGVLGLGELGCSPFELDLYDTNGTTCVENIQLAVKLFNNKLNNLIKYLNNKLSDANFIFASQISNEDPSLAGFTVMNKSCCVASGQSAKGQCLPNLSPCSARDKYIYWDEFHPTELGMMLQTYMAFTALSPLYSGSTDILIKDHQDIFFDSIKTI